MTETGDAEDGTAGIHISRPGIPQVGLIRDAYFPKDTSSLMLNFISNYLVVVRGPHGNSEMAQGLKSFDPKLVVLNSIPRTHRVEGNDSRKLSSDHYK